MSRKSKVDWDAIAKMECELGLTPSIETTVKRARKRARRSFKRVIHDFWYVNGKTIGFIATCVALILVFCGFIYGSYRVVTLPESVPPLPPHVLVGPNNTFVVETKYEALGAILCEDGEFKVHRLPSSQVLIICSEQANTFHYPHSKVWEAS